VTVAPGHDSDLHATSDLRIRAVEAFCVPPRWVLVKIATDAGLTGWGEASLEGHSATVAAAVRELAEYLVGRDPLLIADHWQVLRRGGFYRGGPVLSSALAGLDIALWDLAGRYRSAPVHALLGGPVRRRVRAYSWIGGDVPTQVAGAAQAAVAVGASAVKMNASGRLAPIDSPALTRGIVDRVAAVRDAIGPERDLAVDFHGRLTAPMARRVLPLLEEFHPMFIEEPVVPELTEPLPGICASTSLPIATGERLYSRWEFKPALDAGVAVVQPDLAHAGGISEVRSIAAVAELYGAYLAPHCPLGPVALAACLQVAFTVPNFLIQEHGLGIHYNERNDVLDYLANPEVLTPTDGWIDRLIGPGLGIEIDEERVRRAAEDGISWRTPMWRGDDGSLSEW
jgi:galactonate dehydratase